MKQICWCSDEDEDGNRKNDSDSDGGWCLLLGICCGDRCAVLVEL